MWPRIFSIAIFPITLFAQAPGRLEFEVATIKLNTECLHGIGREQHSPGRFGVECVPLREYIRGAYGAYGKGRDPNALQPKVLGGPQWVDSDKYDIVAKAPDDARLDEMYGPMMRTLLEDRFQLKVHWQAEEMPVYDLTVAKGGTKLIPLKEGGCVPIDVSKVLKSPPPANYCGRVTTKRGPITTVDAYGTTLTEFASRVFRETLDRPVVDKTGLAGRFNIHLEFARDTDRETDGPSIFTALQEQLGLKLSSTRGAVEVLIIDHVEKPSGN